MARTLLWEEVLEDEHGQIGDPAEALVVRQEGGRAVLQAGRNLEGVSGTQVVIMKRLG